MTTLVNTAVDDGLQTRLFMRRPWLYDLPELPVLPQGYTWRVYQPGDLPALAVLLTRAFEDGWDDERVRREVTTAPGVDAVYVMTHQDDMVAMASARVMPEVYPGSGYLDRVAVAPAYQGRGLGRRASIGVLRHFRQAGLRDAVL